MNENKPENLIPKVTEHQLRVKLDRLRRVKDELWQECQPVPPELEAKIEEIRVALGIE